MLEKVHLLNVCESLTELWSPRVVGEVNDQYIKVAKVQGQLAWHKHDNEDEMFFILRGELEIEYEDTSVHLKEGDMHVVPRGTMHNPLAAEECLIALVETRTTQHTGDIVTPKTRSIEDQLGGVG